ncbi:MAG: hypothetical protein HYZ81_09260 [Nitrospinae bacterium]|nr:hypothetical protein [Nitrospinota bacterium]
MPSKHPCRERLLRGIKDPITFLLLGAAVWLLLSTGVVAQRREPLPTVPVKVPSAVQEILGGDTSRSHVSSEDGGLVIICLSPTVEKRSILRLVKAAKGLAQSPEFQAYKNLHGWILRLEDDRGQMVALFVDARKVDTLTALSDRDFLMAVQGIYALIDGHQEHYQRFLGSPPHLRVQPDLEKRKRLVEELGLKETAMRRQETAESLANVDNCSDGLLGVTCREVASPADEAGGDAESEAVSGRCPLLAREPSGGGGVALPAGVTRAG